jgi:light-harvesting protein B-800-850 beta chain
MASDDPNRVWPSGLTTREAEELHDGLKQGTRIFGAISLVAHILAFMWSPWMK